MCPVEGSFGCKLNKKVNIKQFSLTNIWNFIIENLHVSKQTVEGMVLVFISLSSCMNNCNFPMCSEMFNVRKYGGFNNQNPV